MPDQSKNSWKQSPHSPGVYLLKDNQGSILYVGKARNLRKRLANYFSPTRATLSNNRLRALIHSIDSFDYYETRSEQEALLLESKFIKDYRPKYNVLMRDDKRFPILKIPKGEAFPRFVMTRLRKEDGAKYFGPFPLSGALASTVEWMNKHFGLRSCKVKSPGEKNFLHCHADIIRNCSAPCIGKISVEEYNLRMNEAISLLEGTGKRNILKDIEEEMWSAARGQHYEKAAELRDIHENLTKTLEPARRFRLGTPDLPSTINPERDLEDLGRILGLASPPKIMECFDISNISSTHIVASMVRFTNGKPDNKAYRRYRIKEVNEQNDFASMAEVIRRRYTRMLNESTIPSSLPDGKSLYEWLKKLALEGKAPVKVPDLVIVDGGKGQLSSAIKELEKIGLEDMPIVGLAEKHEEIYFPNRDTPLLIPHNQGALKLMQRIRDESHRFANNYNELLLRKRMRESILDEAPGMSDRKKQMLLSKFKSVTKIKQVSAKDIAEIKGISEKWAHELLDWLNHK